MAQLPIDTINTILKYLPFYYFKNITKWNTYYRHFPPVILHVLSFKIRFNKPFKTLPLSVCSLVAAQSSTLCGFTGAVSLGSVGITPPLSWLSLFLLSVSSLP